MNEIVKIHNDLSNNKLSNMNAKELDLLMAICVKVKNQNDNLITISYDDLQKLSNYKQYNTKDLKTDLLKMNENLIKYFIVSYDDVDGASVTTSLFKEFRRYDDRLQVRIADKLLYLLNDLTSNFTAFELQEFVALQSKYSKRLYRLLKQFRTTGIYSVSKAQLYKDLDISETYSNTNFNKRALKPALEECSKCFKNLKCDVKKSGKGGAVQGYTFTFVAEKAEKEPKEPKKKGRPKSNKFNDFDNQQDYDIADLESKLLSN